MTAWMCLNQIRKNDGVSLVTWAKKPSNRYNFLTAVYINACWCMETHDIMTSFLFFFSTGAFKLEQSDKTQIQKSSHVKPIVGACSHCNS